MRSSFLGTAGVASLSLAGAQRVRARHHASLAWARQRLLRLSSQTVQTPIGPIEDNLLPATSRRQGFLFDMSVSTPTIEKVHAPPQRRETKVS